MKKVEIFVKIYENKTKGEKTYYTIMALVGEQETFIANVFKTRYNRKFIEDVLQVQRQGDF